MPPKIVAKSAAPASAPAAADSTVEVLEDIQARLEAIEGQLTTHGGVLQDNVKTLAEIKSLVAGIKTAPAASAPAQSAPTAAARTPAPRAQAAASAQSPAPTPPAAAQAALDLGGDLASLNRKQLIEIATGLGLDTSAKRGDHLREMIEKARAGGGAPSASPAAATPNGADVARRKILAALLEENYDSFAGYLDKNTGVEGCMGCEGNCMACPNPENFPTTAEQVSACFTTFHESLSMPVPAVA